MGTRRKTDAPISRSWFRTDRIVQDGGKWFFTTREGAIEGPFDSRMDAVQQLEVYVRLAQHDMLSEADALARKCVV